MTTLNQYKGEIVGVLHSTADEILQELMGVIEAALEKSVRLTKSGIPPKPLWAAINERLLWKDPRSLLHDWDEVDQIRLLYSIAGQLVLIQPDDERILSVGPGADEFFLASESRRAEMLMRAYIDVVQWDERCDARNEDGHRQNFGQTFRREFVATLWTLRRALIDALACSSDEWTCAETLAEYLTINSANILISEGDEIPETPEGETDAELERLTEYWLMLVARFGWVSLGRTPRLDDGSGGRRVYKVTELGRTIISGGSPDYASEEETLAEKKPFVVQPNNDIVFYREEGDVGDEYLLRRIASDVGLAGWDEPTATYHVTPDTLRRAFETGLDPDVLSRRLLERSKADVPATFLQLIKDAQRRLGNATITQGMAAVELDRPTKTILKALAASNFAVYDEIALVPWRRWHEFETALNTSVTENFRYGALPDREDGDIGEPLGAFEDTVLTMKWSALPMIARDLLDSANGKGDPPSFELGESAQGKLAQAGWTLKSIAEAVTPIVGKLPDWLADGAE